MKSPPWRGFRGGSEKDPQIDVLPQKPADAPTFKPCPLDWDKESRAVCPEMRRLTEPRFHQRKFFNFQFPFIKKLRTSGPEPPWNPGDIL